jgi:molecular chaperone GrpE
MTDSYEPSRPSREAASGNGEDGPPHEDANEASPSSDLEALRAELADKQDRLLRALAETDNVKRRAQREKDDYVRFANESLLRDLIPVLDNLDRALDAARAAASAGSLLEGVELIQREMLKVLERAGVTRYSAVGSAFDPTRHEAIARVVSAEAAPDTVISESLPGYSLNGRVLRPALVAVATAPDENAA